MTSHKLNWHTMETPQETTIELSGIGTSMNHAMLMNMYRTYGPIVRVTHNGTNSAQVIFEKQHHAMQAVEATDGAVVYGKKIKARVQRQFFKATQPCRGFAAGICRKGDMCKYLHVTDAPVTAPPAVKKAKREPKKTEPKVVSEPTVVSAEVQALRSQQVCLHFSRGRCSRGAECHYAHVEGAKPSEPSKKSNRPCLFFQSGVCTRGDACGFVHEPKAAAAPVKTKAAAVPEKTEAPVKKTKKTKKTVVKSEDESEAEPEQSQEVRICIECEKPGVAVWKCVKCDDSLYCDDCNSAVHSARVMAKHKRVKLPPVPTLPRCGECEVTTASLRCEQCEVPFCASCDAIVHKFKSLRSHVRVKVSAKSETTKQKVKEEPKPAKKKKEKAKQEVESTELSSVANHVPYVESVPQLAFSSDSESEDEAMSETVDVADEPMPTVTNSSDTETDEDFDDVKPQSSVAVIPTPFVTEQTSDSESDDDFDDKPTPKPTKVPASVPKMELSSDSESEDEAPAMAALKTVSTPASKLTLAELSSESDNSDVEGLAKPVAKWTPTPVSKPVKNVSESSDDSDDETPSKPAAQKAASKSSSSDSSSSDSSDSEDEVAAKPIAKAPAPYRAAAPVRNKAGGISDGSSHTLVKKIEAFNVSGEDHEMHLDANLNGFERLLAHDCAERLGLAHESVGAGLERHIIISRQGSKRSASDLSKGHKAKKSKHH